MSPKSVQDILPFVQQPSRYLGTEIHTIKKDHDDVVLRMLLAFPDLYEIGTSHFGLQILYDQINRQETMVAERLFAPADDYVHQLKANGLPLASLESHTPVAEFDIVGFSLLYELNYTNILTILDLAGIPFASAQRDGRYPLIIAGGPCTCNPEPMAPFFDAMVIGDGEETLVAMARSWIAWKEETGPGRSKDDLLQAWAGIQGVYVPSQWDPEYQTIGESGTLQRLHPYIKDTPTDDTVVTRAVIADLDSTTFPVKPVVPFGRPVHDRLRMELARGCTRGCRFCQAGMLYRPVRERSPETILALTRDALTNTGYDDLSLLSLSTGDYGCLETVLEQLFMAPCGGPPTAVSLPSLRAGSLSPRMMELIKTVRKTGFTLAPEAGTQRLRDVINKNITEADILQTVTQAFDLGWQVIKLYFMIGLPTETEADLDGIIELVQKVAEIKSPGKKRTQINVSVTTFIPKPFTPFQWAAQLPLAESQRRITYLQERLKRRGLKFKWQHPEVSYLEGLWARGDRRLAKLLLAAHGLGCRFDGWSDHFRFDLWQQAIEQVGLDADFFVTRQRALDEALPWDHIDIGVSKKFLRKEWERAHRPEGAPSTRDCRHGECCGCGVCDFDRIQPKVYTPQEHPSIMEESKGQSAPPNYRKFQLTYEKLDQARYFGHLELVNIFARALRRGAIPVKYTEGFHPKPKIAFSDALPIGIESRREFLTITARTDMDCQELPAILNSHLPSGLTVTGCRPTDKKDATGRKTAPLTYEVRLPRAGFTPERLSVFQDAVDFKYTKKSPKGKLKTIDLKAMIAEIQIINPRQVRITFHQDHGAPPRPAEALSHIFDLDPKIFNSGRVVKFPD